MFYAAVRFHGMYASPDGSSWTRIAVQPGIGLSAGVCPPQAVLPSSCPIYRGEIAVVPPPQNQPSRNEMYAWYVDANNIDMGIWKTLDGGASWNQLNNSGIANCGDFFGGCGTAQGGYVASPTSAAPSSAGTSFTVTVSSSVSQAYSFNMIGV